MKRFFKFLFNLARTLSLLLVLGLLGLSVYFEFNEAQEKEFLQMLDAYEKEQEQARLFEADEGDFGMMGIDEPAPANYEAKKIKIPVKGGNAYVRPSQVMYIFGYPATVVMHNDSIIHTKASLTDLEQRFQQVEGDLFFRSKSDLINCHYVLQLTNQSSKVRGAYQYQHVVKMEDGHTINLSKDKAAALAERLDEMTF